MPNGLKTTLKFMALAIIAMGLVSVLSAIANIADIADRFINGSWVAVFTSLLCGIGLLIAYPVWRVLKMPRAPLPPQETSGPANDTYQVWLLGHLKSHSDPEVAALAANQDVAAALEKLNSKADALIFATASQVFIETALSQNGKLDGLMMLARQVRLVWGVAELYELQPKPERLWYLYSNVAAASILSTSLEDMDLNAMVKPLVTAVLPATAGALPGMQAMTSMVVGSLLDGAGNALLTLRIGELTRQYALPLNRPTPGQAKSFASVKAYAMLSRLAKENVGRVMREFITGAVDNIASIPGKVTNTVANGTKATVGSIREKTSKAPVQFSSWVQGAANWRAFKSDVKD